MNAVYFMIYNFIFIPLFYFLIHVIAIFHPKLRRGIAGRYRTYHILRKAGLQKRNRPVMVVHCASMGEFEHIKSFIVEFKKERPDFQIVVLFFSPSGYENVKSFPGVDLFLYCPFDWFVPVWRFMRRLKPRLWVIAKHDVWPNQVWMAGFLNIPVFLINASLHQQSSRLLWFTVPFHRAIYRHFTKILTISENDRQNFRHLADDSQLRVAGDTKYDQVIYRRDESLKKNIIPKERLAKRWVFVAGSTWPEDQQHILPAVRSLSRRYPEFLAIICPHEPTPQHLEQIADQFSNGDFLRLSEIEKYSGQPIIVVDYIGVLANLYSLGKAAYTGGSFRQNVHNVLEPAVYGIPVLFGPVNLNSHEAQLLKAEGGGIEVHNAEEIERNLEKFMLNDIYRLETGLKAYQVVEKNRGATRQTINTILSFLDDNSGR
jgi:3-deoxy-D-manno-octulosonic-acid transferase